jgi:hypothetical protein
MDSCISNPQPAAYSRCGSLIEAPMRLPCRPPASPKDSSNPRPVYRWGTLLDSLRFCRRSAAHAYRPARCHSALPTHSMNPCPSLSHQGWHTLLVLCRMPEPGKNIQLLHSAFSFSPGVPAVLDAPSAPVRGDSLYGSQEQGHPVNRMAPLLTHD